MYGADMALWILTIALRARTGQVYNVGSDDGITLEKMAGKVASKFRPAPEVVLNASLTGNVPNSVLVPDTTAAHLAFGLRVVTDIDLAIERTIMWYRNRT
jgi:nucleoside-diphosphate-sugar epimerase